MKNRLFVSMIIVFGVLLSAKDLTVKTPNGGENWMQGATRTITWTCNLTSGTLRITLYDGDTNLGAIATSIPVTQLSIPWTVGKLLNAPDAPIGSNYKIKIRHQGESYYDFSDAPFTILKKLQVKPGAMTALPKIKIQVTSPDGSGHWDCGHSYSIRWETAAKQAFVIELFKSNRSVKLATIGTFQPDPGTEYGGKYAYIWKIPSNCTYAPGSRVIRVSTANGSIFGYSPSFYMNKLMQEVQQTFPNSE